MKPACCHREAPSGAVAISNSRHRDCFVALAMTTEPSRRSFVHRGFVPGLDWDLPEGRTAGQDLGAGNLFLAAIIAVHLADDVEGGAPFVSRAGSTDTLTRGPHPAGGQFVEPGAAGVVPVQPRLCARSGVRAGLVAFALHPLAQQLAVAAHRFGLFARPPLRRLLVTAPQLHLSKYPFALHFLL